MFPDPVVFVDLETTCMTASDDRVTEVGIVRVEGGHATEWSSLVNPDCSIPAAVQALTGISNAMVAAAPRFADIASEVATRIAGCIFVAHNARFDYGFLKHEFGRLRRQFTAKVLCTVKLSRRLYPEAGRHNLDTIIARSATLVSFGNSCKCCIATSRRKRSTRRSRACSKRPACHRTCLPMCS